MAPETNWPSGPPTRPRLIGTGAPLIELLRTGGAPIDPLASLAQLVDMRESQVLVEAAR